MHSSHFRMQAPSGRDGSALTSIWIIPSVVLLFAAAVLGWVSYDEYRETIKQEYRFLDAHARIAQGQLTSLLRNVKQLLTRVAEEWPELTPQQRSDYAAILAARNREVPEIRTLAVVDAAGRIDLAVNPVLKGFDASQRAYFTAHRDRVLDPNFFISRPFKSAFGDYSISFSVAMRDRRQQLVGVAVAGVNYKYFESVMTEIQPKQPGSIVAVINDDGDIAFRLPEPEKYVGGNVAAGSAFKTFLRSGRQPVNDIGISQVDGVKRIYAYRAIDYTPLTVVVASPYYDVLATWRHNLIARVALLALAAAAILRLAWIAHRRHREALAERAQLQQLRNREEISRQLVGIQEEERRRLAIELHDRTSPNLTILDINLKLLASALPKDVSTQVVHLIEDTSATLADTVAAIRSASFDFRPPLLDYAGLWAALTAYAQQFHRRTGMAVQITGQKGLRLAPDVETNLFHIAQEALANCARHSRAENVVIRQTSCGSDLILLIGDDGVGFEPGNYRPGQGLEMMRQRAQFIGGNFYVDTYPNEGTSIAVRFKTCPSATWLDERRTGYASASQASRPRPAAYPPAKQAVSR